VAAGYADAAIASLGYDCDCRISSSTPVIRKNDSNSFECDSARQFFKLMWQPQTLIVKLIFFACSGGDALAIPNVLNQLLRSIREKNRPDLSARDASVALGLGETNLARYENGTVQSLPDSVRDKLRELYGLSGDSELTLDWAARQSDEGALPAYEALGFFPPMKSVWGLITSAFTIRDLTCFERAYIHPLAVVASLGKQGPLFGQRGLRELEEMLKQNPKSFVLGRVASSLPPVPTTIFFPGLLVGTKVELLGHAFDRFPNQVGVEQPQLGGGLRSAKFLFSADSVLLSQCAKLMNLMFEEMVITGGKITSALNLLYDASLSVYSLENEIEGEQEAAKIAPQAGRKKKIESTNQGRSVSLPIARRVFTRSSRLRQETGEGAAERIPGEKKPKEKKPKSGV
jgi:hypothetical protein